MRNSPIDLLDDRVSLSLDVAGYWAACTLQIAASCVNHRLPVDGKFVELVEEIAEAVRARRGTLEIIAMSDSAHEVGSRRPRSASFLTAGEVAIGTECSAATVKRALRPGGDLDGQKIGGRWLVEQVEVERWAKNRRRKWSSHSPS
jgi:hypothetical protein